MDSNDFDVEELETNVRKKKPKKSLEEEFQELLYERRCKLVALSRTNDISKFIMFLKENEHIFSKMNECDRECMRRVCESILTKSYHTTVNDIEYCNKIFGNYIDPRNSHTIYESGRTNFECRMTLEEEIASRSKGTYYAMWSFITNPEFQEKLKGRTDLYDEVKYMIDRAKKENEAVSINFKRYEPSDEEMYVKVLGLMKNDV